jgi:hypothetical protein
MGGTVCQAAPCTPISFIGMAVQLCKMDSECATGDKCLPPPAMFATLAAAVGLSGNVCQAPVEAGASSSSSSSSGGGEGGAEGGSSSGASEGGSDAPTGG